MEAAGSSTTKAISAEHKTQTYAYVVMRFDDRNRYSSTGIPANVLFAAGQTVVVWMKEETIQKAGKRNRFAKVKVAENQKEAELVELLGPVGEYPAELEAYQLAFHVKPCRYPKEATWALTPPSNDRRDCTELYVFSVDIPGTRDIDDALSLQRLPTPSGAASRYVLGIHVADVAARLPTTSPLFDWSSLRCASTYHGGVSSELQGGSVPMLPPQLAHDELSLNEGVERCAVSLFLTIEGTTILSRHHDRTTLRNRHATNYETFGAQLPDAAAGAALETELEARALLRALSGEHEPEDLVAWTMLEYNSYFGALLSAQSATSPVPGLLIEQADAFKAAQYVFARDTAVRHESLGRSNYAHCSSPIRRYADLHNQHALFGSFDVAAGAGAVDKERLHAVNRRVQVIKKYHARVSSMELAYSCREAPTVFTGRIETSVDTEGLFGPSLLVHIAGRRVRVPLQDSYFSEPLAALFAAAGNDAKGEVTVELCGVLKAGQMQLRLRVPSMNAAALSPGKGLTAVRPNPSLPPGLGIPKPPSATTPAPPASDEALFELLSSRGVASSLVEQLQAYGIGVGEVGALSVDDYVGLTGCATSEAKAVMEIVREAMSAPTMTSADGDPIVVDALEVGSGAEEEELIGESEEREPMVDHELRVLLAGLGLSSSVAHQLERCGIGLEAARLLSCQDLQELTGCTVDEANAIIFKGTDAPPEDAANKSSFLGKQSVGLTVAEREKQELSEDEASAVFGYPIDDFQRNTLRVIVQPDVDLLAMAPTGSGKTAVALMAILQAFRRGKKAIYTSPIKALSNQKYAEFKSWFKNRNLAAGVTLLTGDIKIRATPGVMHELIICTSEILRNKVVQLAGTAHEAEAEKARARAAIVAARAVGGSAAAATEAAVMGDADLHDLGCVVSDEIHYINDVERGAVWEETLMHLPKDVQMVALSATLREPEAFLSWIGRTRGRPGELVRRTDRHVPLHVGGLDRKTNKFEEFFGTHGEKAGIFDMARYQKQRSEILTPPEKDSATLAAAAALKGERAAEKDALRAEREGGGRGGRGGDGRGGGRGSAKGSKGGGKGSGTGKGSRAHEPSFESECLKIGRALAEANKLPGIIFCMSRKRCVEGAHALAPLNLIGGRKTAAPEKETEEYAAWERAEEKRRGAVQASQRALQAMHRKHLQCYMPELGELEAYKDIISLLDKGIGYHHSGMLPVLREYVELCFQQKLVKLVFATETLAVGVNMPARTVVFSQVDKPKDGPGKTGHRPLRPDEFWQMAGRAGRRGMDELGYVIYAPTLSVAGLSNMASPQELREMLVGAMPAATSQLIVDKPFVLRHLARGYGPEVMDKTLLADQLRRQTEAMKKEIEELTSTEGEVGKLSATEREELITAAKRAGDLETRLAGRSAVDGLVIALNPKQRKSVETELRTLKSKHGALLSQIQGKQAKIELMQADIEQNTTTLKAQWKASFDWLCETGFIANEQGALTPRGRACAAFADGQPLILGTIISDGWLKQLSLGDVCAWLSIFIQEARGIDLSRGKELLPPGPSPQLEEVVKETLRLAEMLEVELQQSLFQVMLDWIAHKDITRIATWVEPHMLGSFVKAVIRVSSYIEIVKEVLLGLNEYEVHNQLDNHMDVLLGGLVTNESLYLRLAD